LQLKETNTTVPVEKIHSDPLTVLVVSNVF
jgi:hypothetical protein